MNLEEYILENITTIGKYWLWTMLRFQNWNSCTLLVIISLVGQLLVQGHVHSKKFHYTPAHHALHKVIRKSYTHLKDFEIAVPEVVDVLGNHVTHDLQHHSRKRRSIQSSPDSETPTFYKISAHNEKFHIGLLPNKMFLDPDFTVKRIRHDKDSGKLIEEIDTNVEMDCHFSGNLISHENSSIAISLCSGMSGLLRTEEDDFIVEPIPPEVEHRFSHPQHPHIVYKKVHLKNNDVHYCGKSKRHPTPLPKDDAEDLGFMSDGSFLIRQKENTYNLSNDKSMPDTNEEFNHAFKRIKRDISLVNKRRSKIVETLVVADQDLIEKHKTDHVDVATYILTVMNMVSALFRDGTLDTNVDIILIGLTLLEDDKEIDLVHKAGKSLKNFCHWQSNVTTSQGRRPDHSILLTGINICVDKDEPCDTLGLAEIGGMCSLTGSCTINEDTGLGLAFTVTHETGHSFGMRHDGQGNACSKSTGQIMSPTINTLNGVFTWSSCSRKAMEEFLKTNQSRCLDNIPRRISKIDHTIPRELPGQIYSADDQCNLQFGDDWKLCDSRYVTDKDYLCKSLWCQRSDNSCAAKFVPASEGTVCGDNYWCRRGKCVPYGSSGPRVVNGGWSKYESWSDCSRSCGIGVSIKIRYCNNPEPMYGGRHCEGEDRIYKLCNVLDCPPSADDFRSQQCAEYNTKQYRHQYFKWVPYTNYWKHGSNKCELICEAEGFGFFDRLSPQVKDGTSCDDDSNSVCIAGKCESVGCDRVLHSKATVDVCGVCKGNNETCRLYIGSNTDVVKDSGYHYVVRLPLGASTIKIWENVCCTYSYIAVRNAYNSSKYYLNGNWEIDMQKQTKFAGVKWEYTRRFSRPQELKTNGSITEPIVIEALIMGKNPGISYSYYLSEIDNELPYERIKEETLTNITYNWRMIFTDCTKSCAGGTRQGFARCMENEVNQTEDYFCQHLPRPQNTSGQCNMLPCPAKWLKRRWQACSAPCGSGIRTREVVCSRTTSGGGEVVSDELCNNPKPSQSKICFPKECLSKWKTGRWTKCSKTCGKGQRTRNVYCADEAGYQNSDKCTLEKKPKSRRGCRIAKCRRQYQWLITAWGKCSTTCGQGKQHRKVNCTRKNRKGGYKPAKQKRCKQRPKPRISKTRTCFKNTCITPTARAAFNGSFQTTVDNNLLPIVMKSLSKNYNSSQENYNQSKTGWITSDWQECSLTCGGGTQFRRVECVSTINDCQQRNKPTTTRPCNIYTCPAETQDEYCTDNFSWCFLVPHHRTCGHKYFGSQCCKSCANSDSPPTK